MKEKFLSNTQLRALLSLATEDERLGITKILDNNANNALSSGKLQNMISLEGGHGFVNFFREQGTGYIDILDDVVSELNIKGLPSYQSKLQFIDEVERINSQDSKYNEAEAIQQGLSYCEQAELKVIQELIKRSYEYLEKQKNKVEHKYFASEQKIKDLEIEEKELAKRFAHEESEIFKLFGQISKISEFLAYFWLAMHKDKWVWPYFELGAQNPLSSKETKENLISFKEKIESKAKKNLTRLDKYRIFSIDSTHTIFSQEWCKDAFQYFLLNAEKLNLSQAEIEEFEKIRQFQPQLQRLEQICDTHFSKITRTMKQKYQNSKEILNEYKHRDLLLSELNTLKAQIEEFDNSINQVVNEFGDNNHSGLVGTAGLMAIANLGGFATYTLLTSFMSAVSFGSLGFGAYTAATSLLSIAIGPVGWIALGSYAVFSLGKPSMSKLMPIVATVGAIRQRIKYEN